MNEVSDHIEVGCTSCGVSLRELGQDDWGIEIRQYHLPGDGVAVLDIPSKQPFCSLDCFRGWIEDEPTEIYGDDR